ncbi:hypothetical protein CR203_10250 [Salipaludibacillus neizhouensis]|uniref:Sporulation protein n=1 Tax=Salipaludibacillus neizhouensis TaxID=885475 RepID=A0A3A9K887_9BACI|nr:DUF1360 domain-containing protein [Salipaludibacillus neizhouensis]RKL67718.1 hypothetical protein CR203_10250 [Salipaludibacillus neizhouensis]
MEISWLHLVLLGLAVFRITHLVIYDKITERFRGKFLEEKEVVNEESGELEWLILAKGRGVQKFLGQLFICHWCLSIWVSFVFIGMYWIFPEITIILAFTLSIAAIAAVIDEIYVTYF